jgi:hypothetical protein
LNLSALWPVICTVTAGAPVAIKHSFDGTMNVALIWSDACFVTVSRPECNEFEKALSMWRYHTLTFVFGLMQRGDIGAPE